MAIGKLRQWVLKKFPETVGAVYMVSEQVTDFFFYVNSTH